MKEPKTEEARGGASRVLDADELVEEVEQPTLDQALSSLDENYGYVRRFGTKDVSCPEQFAAPVTSWDAHVYFDSSDAESTAPECIDEVPVPLRLSLRLLPTASTASSASVASPLSDARSGLP